MAEPGTTSILDRLLGEQGIKTDVKVSLEKSTYINLGVTIILGILIGSALGAVIKNLINK